MNTRALIVRQALLAATLGAALLAFDRPAAAQAPTDPVAVAFSSPTFGQSFNPGDIVFFDADFTNPTLTNFLVTDATFTATDPTVSSEIAGGLISGFFDGSDGAGSPVSVGTGLTSQKGVYELDLDSSLPGGQTIAGNIAFTGYDTSDPSMTPIEVGAQSFSIQTASTAPPVAPEPSSVATFGIFGLFAAGLMFKARKRKSHETPAV